MVNTNELSDEEVVVEEVENETEETPEATQETESVVQDGEESGSKVDPEKLKEYLDRPRKTFKVQNLRPNIRHFDMYAKIVSIGEVKEVKNKSGEDQRAADVLIGDETATVLFTAWNDSVQRGLLRKQRGRKRPHARRVPNKVR